jgi:excinuclease ABC subunit C
LYLLQQVRDEAHRFAITYHRNLRSKRMVDSVLDDIEGIGPNRKRALLKRFGSLKRMRDAGQAELAEVLPEAVATELYAALHRG